MSFLLQHLRSSSTSLFQILQIHAQIIVLGYPFHNHLLSKLVDFFSIDYAQSVFLQIPFPDQYAYNSMIRAHAASGPFDQSTFLYSQMRRDGIDPSNFTYPFVLKACSGLSAIELGQQVHTHVFKFGFNINLFVGNSLIDMYCKCFRLSEAHRVFDEMFTRDIVSWNSIIAGYVHCGLVRDACDLFEEMPMRRNVVCWTAVINGLGRKGMIRDMLGFFRKMLVSADDVKPNPATMVCLVSACSSILNQEVGRWLSTFIGVNAVTLNVILRSALIDVHSKFGEVDKARRFFDETINKNLATWNAMITGYVQNGFYEEAIQLFYRMRTVSVFPDEITVVNLLSACANLGALELGKEVHLYLSRSSMEQNVILATALVDLYSKCGSIENACLVFVKMINKDVALWNAMILGLALHGHGKDALALFAEMESGGTWPNDITFVGVLSACNHSGLVEAGNAYFEKLLNFGLRPRIEHYSCMVDLLGRAGLLREAAALVQSMEVAPDAIIWGSLLNSCRIHGNFKLANEIGEVMCNLKDPNLGCFVLLSNIYASERRWADVKIVRRLMKEKRMRKPSGCSWIEIEGVHRFLVGDTAHEKFDEVYVMLNWMMKQLVTEGYEPNFDLLLGSIDGLQEF